MCDDSLTFDEEIYMPSNTQMQEDGCGGLLGAAQAETRIDDVVLSTLLDAQGAGLWSMEELIREVGERVAVEDSVARLLRAGLAHRCDGFVLASRAAFEYARIAQ